VPLPLPPPPIIADADDTTVRKPMRPPSDPEIETYLEIEAELPPESGDPDLESDLALSIALSGDFVDEDTVLSRTIDESDDDAAAVPAGASLPLTLAEPVRKRAATGQDGGASGAAAHRAKRHSDGWDD
jgi:hypothetical protein